MHSQLFDLPSQVVYCQWLFSFTSFSREEEHEEVPDIVLNTIDWPYLVYAVQHLQCLQCLTVKIRTQQKRNSVGLDECREELYQKIKKACEDVGLLQST